MKLLNIFSVAAMSSILLTACADTDITDITVDMPASMATNPVIDAYAPLKFYIDRSAHPDFKLGGALEAGDYNKIGIVWRLANENFDELTAGNHMKYSFCVGSDGTMNFTDVQTFVKNATTAGLSVYGHTLMWHAQQQNDYLNGLIADDIPDVDPDAKDEIVDALQKYDGFSSFPYYVMGYEPQIIDGILTSEYPGSWYQYFVADGLSLTPGTSYKVTAKIRGSKSGDLNVQLGNWGALIENRLSFSDEWDEVSATFDGVSTTSGFIVFQPGTFDGKVEIEWVKLSHLETPVTKYIDNYVTNGDLTGNDFSCFYMTESNDGPKQASNLEDGALVVNIGANPSTAWDSQFFIKVNHTFKEGEEYTIKFQHRITSSRSIDLQAHNNPGNYLHWTMGKGSFTSTDEWQEYYATTTISSSQAGCNTIAFNLSGATEAAKFYIKDIEWGVEKESNTIPKSDEEKYEILSAELYRWIDGMMEACEGKVVAWDVTNEVMSGSDQDGDGFYEPWSSSNTDDDFKSSNFIWRDYLGDLDVVRLPVKYARECFEKHGGDLSKLKLFVNDYNLESDWDNNAKVKSYAHWIPIWEEEDGVVIDGVSTQMHLSYYENEQTLESKKSHIKQMFEIMAATGKLVRVSELDMGYVDANGVSLKTPELTEDQHKAMAEYYKWIIKTYFEVVPANQQYGICQWCITDAPESSGWRGGEPVGLWDLDYNRKWTYTGFADGLAGK